MNKLIIAFILATSAFQAQAGNSAVCDMRRTQYEYDQCIELGTRGSILRVKGNSERMLQAANVPQAVKDDVLKSHKAWAKQVEAKCGDSNKCRWDMAGYRNDELEPIMRKYGVQPL